MYPPIFELCAADSDVQTNLGASPCRLYPFGEAPEKVTLPYAVWQRVGGAPENTLGDVPDIDSFTIQVDVYGSAEGSVRDAAQALRDVIEQHTHITDWGPEGRDPQTRHYRYNFSLDWWVDRDTQS